MSAAAMPFKSRVERFLVERYGLGFSARGEACILRSFARHLHEIGHCGPLTIEVMTDWARCDSQARLDLVVHINSCRGGVEHLQRDLQREAIRQPNRHRQMGLARPGQHFERLPVQRMKRVVHRHRQRQSSLGGSSSTFAFTAWSWTACTSAALTERLSWSKFPSQPTKCCRRCCARSSPDR
jgi:hypothetical protein